MARKRKLTLVLQLSLPSSYEDGDRKVMPSAQVLSTSGIVRVNLLAHNRPGN